MTYNPIFEEEIERERELLELRKAIKLRASKDQFKDLSSKFFRFVKHHPIFSSLAVSMFSYGLSKK